MSQPEKRYLVLAEEKSADPHYGKTARGVLRYSPHPTVAILDSTRAGETHEGVPVVSTVEEALPFDPTTALVGVAKGGPKLVAEPSANDNAGGNPQPHGMN